MTQDEERKQIVAELKIGIDAGRRLKMDENQNAAPVLAALVRAVEILEAVSVLTNDEIEAEASRRSTNTMNQLFFERGARWAIDRTQYNHEGNLQ